MTGLEGSASRALWGSSARCTRPSGSAQSSRQRRVPPAAPRNSPPPRRAMGAPRRRALKLLLLEEGDGGLAGVVVEEAQRVVAGGEPVTGDRRALPGVGLPGEDPGRRRGEGHRREPGGAKPEGGGG